MVVLPPAQNIIHFLGIMVFSTHFSAADSQLRAVMPRMVPAEMQITAKPRTEGEHMWHGIEPHLALIVFKKSDKVSVTGWQEKTLNVNHDYAYVLLDGDQIRFVPESAPPSAMKPTAKRPATASADVDDLLLPHLNAGALLPAYRAPGFSGATAVVEVPAGRRKGCTYGKRADVEVTVANTGTLTIETTNRKIVKRIVLRRSSSVYVAHVPEATLDRNEPGNGLAHLKAYSYMTPAPDAAGVVPAKGALAQCDLLPPVDQGVWSVGTDYQCSAVSWP